MEAIIIETAVKVMATLLLTLISVLGTWLTAKLAKKAELDNIAAATREATDAAQITAMELQQTVVDGWKAANEDGKLTEEEVQELGVLLIEKALAKMSEPAKNLLAAAGADITEIIKGAGEAMIQRMKEYRK